MLSDPEMLIMLDEMDKASVIVHEMAELRRIHKTGWVGVWGMRRAEYVILGAAHMTEAAIVAYAQNRWADVLPEMAEQMARLEHPTAPRITRDEFFREFANQPQERVKFCFEEAAGCKQYRKEAKAQRGRGRARWLRRNGAPP